MKIWHKIVLGFGLALAMLATVALVTYRSTKGLDETAAWVSQRHEILNQIGAFHLHLIEADSATRGYLLEADAQYLPVLDKARRELADDVRKLEASTLPSQYERDQLSKLRPLLAQKTALLESAIATRQEHGLTAAARLLGNGQDKRATAAIRGILELLRRNEEAELVARASLSEEIGHSATAVVLMGTVLSAVILTLATLFILRDIAVRRRAEEALAEEHNLLLTVINAMPEQVFVTDCEGRYIIDNLSHRSFLGVKSAAEVEGKTARDFFPARIAEQMAQDDRLALEEGEIRLGQEDLVVRQDGQVVWLETTKVPLNDTEGRCVGLVSVSGDVSVRKEAEERLRLAADQLRRSNMELQEFASVASHDLQEPLRKIQAFGDRLKTKCSDALGEVGRDYLERMRDAAGRMQILVQDLLTLSRVTSTGQPFKPVDLSKILKGVVSDLEVRIEQTKAKLEIGFLPTIDADPAQMRQLFQNLISNALKFQPPGTAPEVIVAAKLLDNAESLIGAMPGDQLCRIAVSDNGIGFDDKYADQIFQVFQRLHSRSEYEGTGIGLSVCRKIAERHHGTISAKSRPGEGATFIVTLPVKQRMSEGDETWRADHDSHGG